MTALLIFVAFLIALTIAAIAIVVAEDLRGRGEVAEAPKSPDDFPAKRTCRFNATPHWCADTSDDDAVLAAMEKQLTDVKIPRRWR